MGTVYPGALDAFTNPTLTSTEDESPDLYHDVQHADANDAIEAIQAELGINPRGAAATVAARIAAVEAAASVQVKTDIFLVGSNTWTKEAWAKHVHVILVAAGRGGSSGATAAVGVAALGGGGGAPGAYVEWEFLASELTSTVTATVGATGVGGAAVSTNSTAGNLPSVAAGDVTFGGYLTAKAGTAAGSPQDGGTQRSNACLIRGVVPFPSGSSGYASGSGNTGDAPNAQTILGIPTGGGAGGGLTSGNTSNAGGAGGAYTASTTVMPVAVAATAGTANGGAGGTPVSVGLAGLGGAGGGAGNSAASIDGGAGSAGAFPGGGGGGGGGARNGRSSGAGANGGAGVCVVIQRA